MKSMKIALIPILFSCFSIASCGVSLDKKYVKATKLWDAYTDYAGGMKAGAAGVYLKEYKANFHINSSYELMANDDSADGCLAQSLYVADFNNDGYRELCVGYPVGSGFIDERVLVIDYHNKHVLFELNDRFNNDYYLYLDNGYLAVQEVDYSTNNINRRGRFYTNKEGRVSVDWPEISKDIPYYSLTITGEHDDLILSGPYQPSPDMQTVSYSYRAGDVVVFKTAIVHTTNVVVTLNGEKLKSYGYDIDGLFYRFDMPAKDSELNISLEGDLSSDINFNLVWGIGFDSSYDSKSKELVKTKNVINKKIEDYVTTFEFPNIEDVYTKIKELDIYSYPDEYDAYRETSVYTAPSTNYVLTVGNKTIEAKNCPIISYIPETLSDKAKKFLELVFLIRDTVINSDEWSSLPDSEILYL